MLNENDLAVSNLFLLVNILLWLITFLFYQLRKRYFGAGSFLLLFYLSIAIVGFHLFNHPLSIGWFKEINLFPLLYLYLMMILATLSVLKFNEQRIDHIQNPSNYAFNILCIIAIISSLFQIVPIISNFSSGVAKMLIDSTIGSELYKETLGTIEEAGDGKIQNVPAIISGMLSNISILLFFYLLTREKRNRFIVVGLFISILLSMFSSIASGARGGTFNTLLTCLACYFLLCKFMSNKVKRNMKRLGIFIFALVSIPIILITTSRFGDIENFNPLYSIEMYYGQSFLNFNNYGLDAGGIRNGDRTASLFKQIIWDDVPRNYFERIIKHSKMTMNEGLFYTFVGDFTLDYGPIFSFFLFVVASFLFVRKTMCKNQTILFHQLVLLFFVTCVCSQGAISLFLFSDVAGNLNLIAFILVYYWFKIDYYKQGKFIFTWQK